MKFLILLSLVCIAHSLTKYELKEWRKYKVTHNKVYTDSEESWRQVIWKENKITIEEHNEKFESGEVLYEMALNQFSDMTHEELEMYTGLKLDDNEAKVEPFPNFDPSFNAPSSIDYREKGFVTPVKSQEQCGSCYAFSVTGAIEGQYFKATNKLESFSEQQIVDCAKDRSYHVYGCSGGNMNGVYRYIRDQGGLDTESSYAYKAVDNETCKYDKSHSGVKVGNFTRFGGTEEELLNAVAEFGPISVAIHVASSFHHYSSGIYWANDCQEPINHAVLVVG